MAQNKTFRVSLDMKAPTAQRNEWEVVEGDNGNIIKITLTDDGSPVDLQGCKVLAVFGLPTGQTVEQDTDEGSVTIGGTDHNEITIALKTGSFSPGKSSSGLMKCEIQVYSGMDYDTLVTSAQFTFRCRRAIINDETVPADNNYPILVELIQTVQSFIRTNQSDWTQADPDEPDYIRNKPATMTPSAHASSHAAGGSDEITPLSIGAMAADATPTPAAHASTHATGGTDAITPSAIGAIPTTQKGATDGVAELDSNVAFPKVKAEQASAGIKSISVAAYTLQLADAGKFLDVTNGGNVTITIPLNASVAFPAGTEIEICRDTMYTVTVAGASGVTIKSAGSKVSVADQYGCAVLKKLDTNTWLLAGDLG